MKINDTLNSKKQNNRANSGTQHNIQQLGNQNRVNFFSNKKEKSTYILESEKEGAITIKGTFESSTPGTNVKLDNGSINMQGPTKWKQS